MPGFTGMGCGCCDTGCNITLAITGCGAGLMGWTLAGPGGSWSGSTAAPIGSSTFDIVTTGTYTATVTDTYGYVTATSLDMSTCGATYTTYEAVFTFTSPCDGTSKLGGVAVSVSGPTSGTATSRASDGTAQLGVTPGSYTYSYSGPGIVGGSGSFTIGAGGGSECVSFSPLFNTSTGVCACNCANPFPTTLTLSDSIVGSVTLTWDAVNLWWQGTKSFAVNVCTGCTAATATMIYRFWKTDGTSTCFLQVLFDKKSTPPDCPTAPGAPGSFQTSITQFRTSLTCYPINIVFNPTGGCAAGSRTPWGTGGSPTITITA